MSRRSRKLVLCQGKRIQLVYVSRQTSQSSVVGQMVSFSLCACVKMILAVVPNSEWTLHVRRIDLNNSNGKELYSLKTNHLGRYVNRNSQEFRELFAIVGWSSILFFSHSLIVEYFDRRNAAPRWQVSRRSF